MRLRYSLFSLFVFTALIALSLCVWKHTLGRDRVDRTKKLVWRDGSVGIIEFNPFDVGWDFRDTERGSGTYVLISEFAHLRGSTGAWGHRVGLQLPTGLREGQRITFTPAAIDRADSRVVGDNTISRMRAGEFTAFNFGSPHKDTMDDSFSTSHAIVTIASICDDSVVINLTLNASFDRMNDLTIDGAFTLSRRPDEIK
ncbi:hypothetical protein [Rhodopirellula sp. SWK7]|uniref:hypothetical protein n=1 Tax=Rhodopirellula sp. SWK7 TaxID=595460 RepID=UPI0002BD9BDF|nr:hypothetical protein [Rhodopirellula sp. SWK7]EMI41721.1 secreted protein [Rhodopirellula sp. SWK7]